MVGKVVEDKIEEVGSRAMRVVVGRIGPVSLGSLVEDMSGSQEVR